MTVRGNQPQFYLVPIQHHTDVKIRSRQIKHRLERLENGHRNLKADQKWPSTKSLNLHLYQQLNGVPEIRLLPPTPKQRSGWDSPQPAVLRPSERTLEMLLAPTTNPRADFPFPITTGERPEELSFIDNSFIYFPFLPIELRLQIFEIELRRPKFIEAQFSSQFYSPTFIGSCTRGSALLSVCRESRELALSLDSMYRFLTPEQRDFGKKYVLAKNPFPHLGRDIDFDGCNRWSRTPLMPQQVDPEKALPFIPESDTVFFRSLDRPQGGLQSMACSVAGFENIQHLALPLKASGLPLRNEWKMCLGLFRDLKTLTLMVGGKDQSWFGEGEIELRDVEEWFVDGRKRQVKVDRWMLDVNEVGAFMSGTCFEERMKGSWDLDWEGVNVRVVAWRKGA